MKVPGNPGIQVLPDELPGRRVTAPQMRPMQGLDPIRAPSLGDPTMLRKQRYDTPQMKTPQVDTPALNMPQSFRSPEVSLPLEEFHPLRISPPDQMIKADNEDRSGQIKAKQLGYLGESIGQAADVAGKIALTITQQANELAVKDAVSRMRTQQTMLTSNNDEKSGPLGFQNYKGKDAVYRDGEKTDIAGEYVGKFDEQRQEIAKGLRNDAQRTAFKDSTDEMRSMFESQLVGYKTQQFRDYNISVQKGTIDTAADLAARDYTNPLAIAVGMRDVGAATVALGRAAGKSEGEIIADVADEYSKLHKTVIETALVDNNVGFAGAYIEAHKGEIRPDMLANLRKAVNVEVDTNVGMTAANDAIMSVANGLKPSELTRGFENASAAYAGIVQQESGGRQTDGAGKVLLGVETGKGKAVGAEQIMPYTAPEAAKLAGMPYDKALFESASKEGQLYRRRLGQAYFEHQVQEFGGDMGKAAAAYNAGPKWVQQADDRAAKARAAGKTGDEANWFWQLNNDNRTDANHKQTREYVQSFMGRMAKSPTEGLPPKPTWEDVRHIIERDPRIAGNATRTKTALDFGEKAWNDHLRAEKQHEEETLGQAYAGIYQNGGSFDSLPTALRGKIMQEMGDKLPGLRSFAEQVRKPQDRTDDMAAYASVTAHPSVLARMTDAQWTTYGLSHFTPQTFKQLSDDRGKLRNPSSKKEDDPGNVQVPTINTVVEERMSGLGISKPRQGSKDYDAYQAHEGAMRRFVRGKIADAQYARGKPFNEVETEDFVNKLFTQRVQTTRGPDNTPVKNVELMGMTISDLPRNDKVQIEAALKKQGMAKPTDDAILEAYWKRYSRIR